MSLGLRVWGAYGPKQFAYAKGTSYKDTLMLNVCSWLLLIDQGLMVGVYCSDVSGAFDRVSKERLCAKLHASGVHAKVVCCLPVGWRTAYQKSLWAGALRRTSL